MRAALLRLALAQVPAERSGAVDVLVELVDASSDGNLLKLLSGRGIATAAALVETAQAVRAVGVLSGSGLGEGDLACTWHGKAAIVADVEVGGSDLGAVGIEER